MGTNYDFDRSTFVYTSQEQCEALGASYYDKEGVLSVQADNLLGSRLSYDDLHKNLLEPLGNARLKLVRTSDIGPGWWRLIEAI